MDALERKLQGRTLQVYLYLQRKKGPSGIREVQRDLGLSSPSVAEYQVDKLVGMSLVAKDSYGRVFVTKKVKVKALESYVNFGRFSVPRLAFYATMFSAIAVLYVALNTGWTWYGVAVPAGAAAVLWLEGWKMWKFSLLERAEKKESSEDKQSLWPMLAFGIIALAAFVIGLVFLYEYAPDHSAFVQSIIPAAEEQTSRPTIEESVELSRQKVVSSKGETVISMPSSDIVNVMSVAGAGVVGFLAFLLVRYRSDSVLSSEQSQQAMYGTQD